jgi:hypothetical protein
MVLLHQIQTLLLVALAALVVAVPFMFQVTHQVGVQELQVKEQMVQQLFM